MRARRVALNYCSVLCAGHSPGARAIKASTTEVVDLHFGPKRSCAVPASAGAVSLGISSNKALSAVTREEATRGCARLRVGVGARFNPTTLKRKVCTLTAASFS